MPNDHGTPITYYTLFMDSDGNNSDDYYQVATTSEHEYLIASGIVQGVTYKFKLIATNERGSSASSEPGVFLAASTPDQPDAPQLESQDAVQIIVKWHIPNSRGQPVTGFEVVWDAGLGGVPRTVLATLGSNVFSASTSIVIPDLVDGANYLFAVRALNSLGYGAYSDASTFMAATVPGKPSVPTVIQASAASITI
jgi:hypothetical protein